MVRCELTRQLLRSTCHLNKMIVKFEKLNVERYDVGDLEVMGPLVVKVLSPGLVPWEISSN